MAASVIIPAIPHPFDPDAAFAEAALADAALTPADFAEISRTVAEVAGIQLRAGKEGLVRARLARRLRGLGIGSYREYLERVRADATRRELAHLVDLLTTNKTSFFREPAHFDVLRTRVAPEFSGAPGGLRIWSAGCSTGEEPYTIAMVLRDAVGDAGWRAARVLATDISARVLGRARAAVYVDEAVANLDPVLLRRHFARRAGPAGTPPAWAVGEALRAPVRFARLNLVGPWPMRGPFHAIFCRNVMIYFDKPTQQALVARYHALLAPGGYLFVGHSESLSGLAHAFEYVQPAAYRKAA